MFLKQFLIFIFTMFNNKEEIELEEDVEFEKKR
jgi:hypothetical protein